MNIHRSLFSLPRRKKRKISEENQVGKPVRIKGIFKNKAR